MKVKLFTHTDLDGVGCAIVAKQAFGDVLSVTYAGYGTIDRKVSEFIRSGEFKKFDVMFITDISVNEEVATLIDAVIPHKTILLDHHATAEWLNAYSWATVSTVEPSTTDRIRDEVASSGTSMLYEFLSIEGLLAKTEELTIFCEQVRQYDSWEWETIYKSSTPQQLNRLFEILGLFRFYKRFSKNVDILFNGGERLLLELEDEKIESYVKRKSNELLRVNIQGYEAGVVFAEQYISELGNRLAKHYNELDFIMLVNPSTSVSYRGIRNDIDLGELAQSYGGGGHKKAAGSPMTEELRVGFLKSIVN